MDNEVAEIRIGNPPHVQPDVGQPVQIAEEPPKKDICLAPSTLLTDPRPNPRKKRTKRGRPKMTKTAKKAAAKAKAAKKAPATTKTVAKKAPAKSAALATKKEPAKAAFPLIKLSPAVAARVEEFEPREGTLRKRLLIALLSSVNKPLREVDLQVTLYGEITTPSKQALAMVLKGVAFMIAEKKLKYTLEKDKNGDGETIIVIRNK